MTPQKGGEFVEQESNSDFLLIGVTEIQVSRFTNYNVKYVEYSRKKKLQTTKNLAITDELPKISYIHSSEKGSAYV